MVVVVVVVVVVASCGVQARALRSPRLLAVGGRGSSHGPQAGSCCESERPVRSVRAVPKLARGAATYVLTSAQSRPGRCEAHRSAKPLRFIARPLTWLRSGANWTKHVGIGGEFFWGRLWETLLTQFVLLARGTGGARKRGDPRLLGRRVRRVSCATCYAVFSKFGKIQFWDFMAFFQNVKTSLESMVFSPNWGRKANFGKK